MRNPNLGNSIVTSRIKTLPFNKEYNGDMTTQIMYMGLVNFEVGQSFYYAVTGGTGDFIGVSGQVTINNFLTNTMEPMNIEVCLLEEEKKKKRKGKGSKGSKGSN